MLAVALLLAPNSALALKIGVVDMERAIRASDHFDQVRSRLEQERAKLQAVLDQQESDLERRRQELEAKSAVSTAESLQAEQAQLMTDLQRVGQQFMVLQQQLQALEQRYTGQLFVRFQAIVRSAAVERDLDFVFDEGADGDPNVLFSTKALDLTEIVVELYQKQYKDKPLELD